MEKFTRRYSSSILNEALPRIAPNITTNSGVNHVRAGLILKRNPVILRSPTPLEISSAELKIAKLNRESTPYAASFFETQKGMRKNQGDGIEIDYVKSRSQDENITENVKALDRHLSRSLYLIVKQQHQDDKWEFPHGDIKDGESLDQAVKRWIAADFGTRLDFWIVGKAPVAHLTNAEKNQKIYFMKSQIFSGQVNPDPSSNFKDFAWVTKDEMSKFVGKDYFNAIKDSLSSL